MVAKQLLPAFGGSAAVWLTCLVFFQTALLAGYAYAHWLARGPRQRWIPLHLALLGGAALAALAWSFRSGGLAAASSHPFLMVFQALLFSIGLPFLLLGSTSPLLQAWLARLEHARIPYRLFALSNLASLLALALYPTVVEPYLTLRMQRILWSGGFVCFAAISAAIAWRMRGMPSVTAAPEVPPAEGTTSSPLRAKLLWLVLPMVAAMQLCAVTSYMTANIAAIPLLWILPLAAYLLTLILAFEYAAFVPRSVLTRLLVLMLAALAYMMANVDAWWPVGIGITFFLIEMFFACLLCHVEAYRLRPQSARELTSFYLLFAAGGAIGSFLISVASPLLFSSNYDMAITFFATALAVLFTVWPENWSQRLLWAAATGAMIYLLVLLHAAYRRDTLFAARNFYATLRVKQTYDSKGQWTRTLTNGIILHGSQIFTPELRKTPTTYYAEDSGIGLAMRYCCGDRARNVGVVGLGAGTIAAYGRPGDRMRFYEINPAVLPIAQHLFTYLRDSAAQISFAEGDARASLAGEAPQHFDVLAIDAFSGDAIPLHLLTTQAMAIYCRHLAPGGVLAFHISNRHVDLEPAIALLAQSAGMRARVVQSYANDRTDASNATWMLVTSNDAFLALPAIAGNSRPARQRAGLRLWTDDYSALLPLLR